MLLAIDVGNTNVVFALFDTVSEDGAGRVVTRWRIATDARRTADEYAVWLMQLLDIEGIARDAVSQIIIATVVPRALRVILEALVRHCDGVRVTEDHVRKLAAWQPKGARTMEIPLIFVRIVLQDLIGFGTLNDLAAMRAAAERMGVAPSRIEPLVPVDVVVDHSVEIDVYNTPDAVQLRYRVYIMKCESRDRACP